MNTYNILSYVWMKLFVFIMGTIYLSSISAGSQSILDTTFTEWILILIISFSASFEMVCHILNRL